MKAAVLFAALPYYHHTPPLRRDAVAEGQIPLGVAMLKVAADRTNSLGGDDAAASTMVEEVRWRLVDMRTVVVVVVVVALVDHCCYYHGTMKHRSIRLPSPCDRFLQLHLPKP